ncbi:MAG: ATP-dependent nuclease, partial [Pseudonocardiaceae bacterium]
MYIESLALENFQCFGPGRTVINLQAELTAFIGANGSGKTAACQALLRLFGISADDRAIRADDFHVPAGELTALDTRTLTIEAVLAFPELDDDDQNGKDAVPEFFHRMAATDDGVLKCRIVLQAMWEADGTIGGAVSDTRRVVLTFADEYGDEDWVPFPHAERARIQMIYVPASRDGARQVMAFLRGRLWRAAQWSPEIRELVTITAADIERRFYDELATTIVQTTLASRWQQLHDAGTHATPRFRPLESDFTELLRSTELVFEPDHSGQPRPARMLSDGQRSLLHLALTATALDIETALAAGKHAREFDLGLTKLPSLTLVAVEEPENSLAPFFLSRIVAQIQQLCENSRAQAVIASHSASVLTRINPESIRYFRLDPSADTAVVRPITLPADGTDAGKYVREAVQAHPELYFARFVVLGEGDSEQLVIPRIAQAHGVALDPSFVAMVPLGGRHTNHFWRLLTDLDIPHATLLDLDYGRFGGGPGRLREACKQLTVAGVDVFADFDGYESVADLADDLTTEQIKAIMAHLRGFGVFFT